MTLSTPQRLSTDRNVASRRRDATGRAIGLTWVLIGLLASAALAGLLVEGVYTGAESTAEMLRGYDVVNLLVVVPALAVTLHLARKGSVMAHLVLASVLGYVVYTYAYYLFGTGFNDLFLVHAAVFSTGLVAFGLTLACLDRIELAEGFHHETRVRSVAGILGVLAAALGGMWVYFAIHNAVTGDVPTGSRLVETDTVVHLGMALDLTLLVPLYAAAAVLLWQRAPWGYVLAGVALLAGLLHQLSYLVAMPFQVAADVTGAVAYDPGEPVIVALYVTGLVLLARGTPWRNTWR